VREKLKDKNFILLLVVSLMLVAIVIKLMVLQVAKGEDYQKQAMDKLTNSVTVSAPRGVIYDRNGMPLISNRVGFSVQVVYSGESTDKINDVLLSTINVLAENEDAYVDSLPISKDNYTFTYKDDNSRTREEKITAFREKYDITPGSNGRETLMQLAERYSLDNRYTEEEIRKIVGVRYELEVRGLAYGAPVTIAGDVSMNTVSVLKENSDYYFNINVISSPFRRYVHGSMASHILGRVGVIYQEEYELFMDNDYELAMKYGNDMYFLKKNNAEFK
jgi:penicillin-binding protein 2